MRFRSGSGGNKIPLTKVATKIVDHISSNPDYSFTVSIGTDSQVYHKNGDTIIKISTVILVYKEGNGAIYFLAQDKKTTKNTALWSRMFEEAQRSIDVAEELVPLLKDLEEVNNKIIIDIDIGPDGKTRDTIKTIVGMVTGYGYEARIKPNAVATRAADKHCRGSV